MAGDELPTPDALAAMTGMADAKIPVMVAAYVDPDTGYRVLVLVNGEDLFATDVMSRQDVVLATAQATSLAIRLIGMDLIGSAVRDGILKPARIGERGEVVVTGG